jgi:hypothetical protein
MADVYYFSAKGCGSWLKEKLISQLVALEKNSSGLVRLAVGWASEQAQP